MTEFVCKFADNNVRIRAGFETTKEFCHDYISSEKADLFAEITNNEIAAEREKYEFCYSYSEVI